MHCSFNISIIRESLKIKNVKLDIGLGIILLLSTFLIDKLEYSMVIESLLYVSCFGFVLLIWLFKEVYSARRVQQKY